MGFTNKTYLQRLDKHRIRSAITHGTSDGFMPGFASENGGPLDEAQIESLVNYFQSIKKRWSKFLKLDKT